MFRLITSTLLTLPLGLLLAGCAPRMVSQVGSAPAPVALAAAPASSVLVVIPDTEPFDGAAEELSDIYIKDSGFTLICDYETVVALASTEARRLGANVLRIYEHRLPDAWVSSCHRIRAKALRVPDITPYEKEVVWTPTRRLRIVDFKASTADRPFEAATSSGIRYHYAGKLFQQRVQLTIETVFDCQNSYFKGQQVPELTLAHEQGHFDIAEIFARRFAQAIQEQVADTKELEQKQEAIYRRIATDAQTMQDKYDTAVYADRSQQPAWLATIAQELAALDAYASKQVSLKMKL